VTAYEAASLWAQWVGSISAALAVLVAAVFGYLTYANNRRSRDNQERATLAAAMEDSGRPRAGLLPSSRDDDGLEFGIRRANGNRWLLVNKGPETAWDVRIEGLTALDRQRLDPGGEEQGPLEAGGDREFGLVSRLTLSGPANVVVSYRRRPDGPELRRVLQVPSA
jgi:hypothetical protein